MSRCEDHYASVNTVESKDACLLNPIKNSSQLTEVRKPTSSGWGDQNSPAIANAMKCLQSKIAELEGRLESATTEKDHIN
jgi:hypothetical protein